MNSQSPLAFGLTAREVLRWFELAQSVLEEAQPLLNRVNVFPVADADTGTNMRLTIVGALEQARITADDENVSAPQILAAAAFGALTSARGNSGIIVAEYLRGIAQGSQDSLDRTAVQQLLHSLECGSDRAYAAVAQPVEGTILTAAREAAAGGRSAGPDASVSEVLTSAVERSVAALERSHAELAVLGRAGVLDAGAYGLVLLLSALQSVIAGEEVVPPKLDIERQGAVAVEDASFEPDGEFEVMCLVAPAPGAVLSDELAEQCTSAFRSVLSELGDSVVVIGGRLNSSEALWSVHVHTDSPDAAISGVETAAPVGVELSQIVIRSLSHQVGQSAGGAPELKLVACVSGPQLAPDLARAGAVVCVERAHAIERAHIERARTEVHHDAAEPQVAIVVANSPELAQEISPDESVRAVCANDDAQVVAVVSAIVAEWESGSDPEVDRLLEVAHKCLGSLVTMRVDHAERVTLAPLINEIAESSGGTPVVTLLVDRGCLQSAVADVCDGIMRSNGDSEIVVLASGRMGQGLTASVEWIDD